MLPPQLQQCVLDQRQRAGLVGGIVDHGGGHFAHVEPGQLCGQLDGFAQAFGRDGGQQVALAAQVVQRAQARQLLDAVQKVGPHGADHKERAVGVEQRLGQKGVESLALRFIGRREQLFKLVDHEQEGGVGLLDVAHGKGQRALVAGQALAALQCVALLRVSLQAVFQRLGQPRHRVLARHHRPEDAPLRIAGARPQRAAFDHRQQASVDE